ncbi:hypothetical protein [Acetobacter conturbans]|uniref:Uncharacterized protein n=1 Tax=Acetobacter conturbans TaxID=1737472 RepID=A0ABX0K457_9PROT|nr:hypothetical protein [Acetobacter conturbans]NHN88777.1 hypothetical protein [Acetobacter conturbans]
MKPLALLTPHDWHKAVGRTRTVTLFGTAGEYHPSGKCPNIADQPKSACLFQQNRCSQRVGKIASGVFSILTTLM